MSRVSRTPAIWAKQPAAVGGLGRHRPASLARLGQRVEAAGSKSFLQAGRSCGEAGQGVAAFAGVKADSERPEGLPAPAQPSTTTADRG
jgi:hypothetical protein